VLCEKPISVTVREGDAMVAACNEAGVLLGVVFQQRAEPARRAMKKMVDDSVLGSIHRVEMSAPWYRTQSYYDSGAWRGTWKGEGGGVLMNQAPHSLDQFLWIGGAPLRVQAVVFTRLHNIEVENTCTAICDYGDGKAGTFYVSTADLPAPERFEIWGDKGALRLENNVLSHWETGVSLAAHLTGNAKEGAEIGGEWRTVEVPQNVTVYDEVLRAFARAVKADEPALMIATGEEGLVALELANAFLLAGFTHREVELPLNRATYSRFLSKLRAGS
jgi:predicted dehydrogenase